jgi:hypothetical protein
LSDVAPVGFGAGGGVGTGELLQLEREVVSEMV